MKVDLSTPNPVVVSIMANPEQLLVVDANFFIPPNRMNLGARQSYSLEEYRRVWIDPMQALIPNLAVHETVLDELVEDSLQRFAQERIKATTPPSLIVLSDSTLSPTERALRQSKELLIAPYTNYDPMRDNRNDRGEVKTLAYMSVKGLTYFSTHDANALRLTEKAAELGTSLDNVKTLKFYDSIYLLLREGTITNTDARNLYRYLYYMTVSERKNPSWADFCIGMDKLYP